MSGIKNDPPPQEARTHARPAVSGSTQTQAHLSRGPKVCSSPCDRDGGMRQVWVRARGGDARAASRHARRRSPAVSGGRGAGSSQSTVSRRAAHTDTDTDSTATASLERDRE
ncbi:unnamed protein product [Danaus chrysippus]|uniref:(African queen) hypothetical protein n=1 Tax=Danaus chrysippus TaxID=151541 RepID=A0A8J2QH27_9NEOP|nr:unnamed protein product [Danaus chrysippus]